MTGRTANSPVTEDVAILKKELETLKLKINEVDTNRSEVTFTFELKGVESLFALDAVKKSRSELFYCRGELHFVDIINPI